MIGYQNKNRYEDTLVPQCVVPSVPWLAGSVVGRRVGPMTIIISIPFSHAHAPHPKDFAFSFFLFHAKAAMPSNPLEVHQYVRNY